MGSMCVSSRMDRCVGIRLVVNIMHVCMCALSSHAATTRPTNIFSCLPLFLFVALLYGIVMAVLCCAM
jgi:hypothetical protein